MIVYFSGIGSTKLSPIAEIAFDAGYLVHGSELDTSVTVSRLIARGIEVDIGYQNGNYLEKVHNEHPINYVIKDERIDDSHPEIIRAKKLDITIIKKDELLSKLIDEKNLKLIAVGGSHGKTTVTAMLIWAFRSLNIPISYIIQDEIKFGPSGSYDQKSEYFIYECDEYDKNFLSFKPFLSLITSVGYNHPETYLHEKDYHKALREFVEKSDRALAWEDEQSRIFDELENIKLLNEEDIDKNLALISPRGQKNASLAKACLSEIGINDGVIEALNKFPGLGKRFEKLAENYYVDCGRNPTEVDAALEAAHKLNTRVSVVYQPYSNLLQKAYMGKYTNQFKLAEKIYWLPTDLDPDDKDAPRVATKDLIDTLDNKARIKLSKLDNDLWYQLEQDHSDGMLVICIGAGSLDGWIRGRLA